MKLRAIQLLPGPCFVIGDHAVFVRPSDGFRLSEQIARLSFRKALIEEADAAALRSAKRKASSNGNR